MTSPEPDRPRIAAFFDLDKTVLAASSTFAIGRGFRRRGMLPPSTAARSVYAHASYMLRGADHVQMERMRDLLSDLVTGWETEVVAAVVAEALEDVLVPLVYAEAAGQVVAVAGYRVMTTLAWGRIVYIDDLVALPGVQGRGFGALLLSNIKTAAIELGCDGVHLDTGYQRHAAHVSYLRNGFDLVCHHLSWTRPVPAGD